MVASTGGVMHSNGSVYGNETSDGIVDVAADSRPVVDSTDSLVVEDECGLLVPFEQPTVAFGAVPVDAAGFFDIFCSN